MGLPNSYTMKTGAIGDYFDAMLNAQAPDRFSYKFLEGIGFASSNDRLLIGILKELGFLNQDGAPQDRYYQFLDKSKSEQVIAEGIREAYSDLFAVNNTAHNMTSDEAFNKLRSLYRGEKKDSVVKLVSKTFVALCEHADFESASLLDVDPDEPKKGSTNEEALDPELPKRESLTDGIAFKSLQYHINIVLPDTRDQSVYDAIFKSLRAHLG